ncbi:MAG: hypothetical protein AB1861_09895 [Cyanobacteriota bacterium]
MPKSVQMDGVITDFSDIPSASPSQKSLAFCRARGRDERYNLIEGAFIKSVALIRYPWHTSFRAG